MCAALVLACTKLNPAFDNGASEGGFSGDSGNGRETGDAGSGDRSGGQAAKVASDRIDDSPVSVVGSGGWVSTTV